MLLSGEDCLALLPSIASHRPSLGWIPGVPGEVAASKG